uniref:Uncharacterized protein n=1 Tax=Thermogemmatispora argillosa TaxID=2045280 RepID=A0A455SWP3_9CHLR|nr:hypothetical protein KTA_02990 [Thermogemmatispora argillosa]
MLKDLIWRTLPLLSQRFGGQPEQEGMAFQPLVDPPDEGGFEEHGGPCAIRPATLQHLLKILQAESRKSIFPERLLQLEGVQRVGPCAQDKDDPRRWSPSGEQAQVAHAPGLLWQLIQPIDKDHLLA